MERNTASLSLFSLAAALLFIGGCSKKAEEPQPAPTPDASASAQTSTHAFQIGELQAIALRDGGIELPNDNQVLGVGLTPEDVAAVLAAGNLPGDKIALSVQPLLVKTADRVLLFDTGAGTFFGPSTGKLQAALQEAGVDPASINDIFISHSHGDHVGGLVTPEWQLAFPNATVRMTEAEWKHLSGQEQMAQLVAAIEPRVETFAPGAEVVRGTVMAVEVKGHTPGHSAYRISSGSEAILYIGDSMHHSVVSVQRPEWTISFDGDNAVATQSRVALVDQLATSGERVYAVHFPFPGIGHIEKRGERAVWVAQ